MGSMRVRSRSDHRGCRVRKGRNHAKYHGNCVGLTRNSVATMASAAVAVR